MKILIATDCYIFHTGGVTNVILSLKRGLCEKGHEVRVLALSDRHQSFRNGEDYFIRSRRFPVYPEHRFSLAMHDPLLQELRAWKPDIVHIHTEATAGWMAKAIARETHTPVVMTTHTDFEYFNFGRFRDARMVKWLGRVWGNHAYRQAEAVIVPAEKARAFPHLQGCADRVKVIPNGVQPERYQGKVSPEEKAALFGRYGLRDNGYTLVMVTRLSREKNVMEILQYFPALLRELPEAQMIITGFGPDRKRLESFSIRNGLEKKVRFTGRAAPEDVYRYYAMGDLFVSASTFELHSMSWLEAMIRGLPMVCREDPSLTGVLEDRENGMIYRDQEGFVRAVSEILRDRALLKKMGENALRKAETFGYMRHAERTLDLYASVIRAWEKKKTDCICDRTDPAEKENALRNES